MMEALLEKFVEVKCVYQPLNRTFSAVLKGSTDAARAAADIVLTEEGLSTIVEGIIISRCIFQRIQNFITYRLVS